MSLSRSTSKNKTASVHIPTTCRKRNCESWFSFGLYTPLGLMPLSPPFAMFVSLRFFLSDGREDVFASSPFPVVPGLTSLPLSKLPLPPPVPSCFIEPRFETQLFGKLPIGSPLSLWHNSLSVPWFLSSFMRSSSIFGKRNIVMTSPIALASIFAFNLFSPRISLMSVLSSINSVLIKISCATNPTMCRWTPMAKYKSHSSITPAKFPV
mmetsp:Transcript_35091/g.68313  ORF Transcript_35091/g.68313 Transcript_35091/m.68313 type:complete len:209 (-) Transcript_35091:815-1441(-)